MTTAEKIKAYEMRYANELREYVAERRRLAQDDPGRARKEARESLIRSGVLNPDGTEKEQIVFWGY